MENFTVYFTNQINRESKALEVFLKDELIAHAQLNLCSNVAHVQILEKHRKNLNDLSVNGYDLEQAIEEREIAYNRILVK